MTIRRFRQRDWRSIAELSDDEWLPTNRQIADVMLDSEPYERCYVAEEEGIVGYIYGFKLRDMLMPVFVYVKPEYRNRGIARELEKALESEPGIEHSLVFYDKRRREHYRKYGYVIGRNVEVSMK